MKALAARRTPARPGPGPMPEGVLRSLDLSLRRRVEGLLAGDHRSARLGVGTELAQIRPYVPGDDVRRIDWNATARTGETHVRVDLAERAVTTWLALDASPSMTFGTADRRKADVAEGVALALGHAATRRGNRLGIVRFGDGAPVTRRPRQGRAGIVALAHELRREPAEAATGATQLGEVLAGVGKVAGDRALVAVVSDFRGPRDWQRPLAVLAARHDVLAVEIRDPREQELVPVGHLALVDPETGRQVRVDTSSRKLRERFASAAEAERGEVAEAIRAAGADHVVLSTAGDWLRVLATFLARRGGRR